jgi:hypothetical protein
MVILFFWDVILLTGYSNYNSPCGQLSDFKNDSLQIMMINALLELMWRIITTVILGFVLYDYYSKNSLEERRRLVIAHPNQ